MAWNTLVLVFTMFLCTACAKLKLTHFTSDHGKTAQHTSQQLLINCLEKNARVCAVKCATSANCESFRSSKMTIWVKERWNLSLPPDNNTSRMLSSLPKQEDKGQDECSGLPKLQHGNWQRHKKTDSAQSVSVICKRRTSSKKREITCDKARNYWLTVDSDCKDGAWTYLGSSPRLDFPYTSQLKDLKGIELSLVFNGRFTIFLYNSKMPLYKLKFTLTLKKVDIMLLSGQNKGRYSKLLYLDAPKRGQNIVVVIRSFSDNLRYRLSKGERTCRVPVSGFTDGINKLTLEKPDTIQTFKAYFQ